MIAGTSGMFGHVQDEKEGLLRELRNLNGISIYALISEKLEGKDEGNNLSLGVLILAFLSNGRKWAVLSLGDMDVRKQGAGFRGLLAAIEIVKKFRGDGSAHVDILKMPHHGSSNNIDATLSQVISCRTTVLASGWTSGDVGVVKTATMSAGVRLLLVKMSPDIDNAKSWARGRGFDIQTNVFVELVNPAVSESAVDACAPAPPEKRARPG